MNELARKNWQGWVEGATSEQIRARMVDWAWEYVAASDAATDEQDYHRRRQALGWKYKAMEEELAKRNAAQLQAERQAERQAEHERHIASARFAGVAHWVQDMRDAGLWDGE